MNTINTERKMDFLDLPVVNEVKNIPSFDSINTSFGDTDGDSTATSKNFSDDEDHKPKKQHTLLNMYYKFTNNSACMDSLQFCKLCRDCKIADETFSIAQCDITFIEVKGRSDKKITYKQFKASLDKLAKKKGCTRVEILRCIRDTHGPTYKDDSKIKIEIANTEKVFCRQRSYSW
eukprot:CAMPEP_0114589236 /NCGR_PEP_ID=MMETSP0125-20121206/11735_1 /TAXON_ID=485358 ORGANISM="Aristerostoma sp., Strain ATCC 50986" /NCGR_SAMPLE_ID=MMETSP0125 /ASSEMBLY_ACC=CAM_ASM_000245 /LENGTH=175 /DNA_ID=CAMNT_0001786023 /DNA_START=49 /DNA_END=576 /DNA_ORIENTATION=-